MHITEMMNLPEEHDISMKFLGVPENTFSFHLKELEFRFNYQIENIYAMIPTMHREKNLI